MDLTGLGLFVSLQEVAGRKMHFPKQLNHDHTFEIPQFLLYLSVVEISFK